jgi:hypothetical protein
MTAALLAAIGVLALAPAAHAQDPNNPILNDLQDDGQINNPCQYNPEQLRQGINNLPPDVQQYGDTGVGGCNAPGAAQQAPPQVDVNGEPLIGVAGSGGGPPPPSTQVEVAEPPAPRTEPIDSLATASSPAIGVYPSGSDAPWWLPLLGIIVLASGLALLVKRQRGWSAERFTRPARAAASDAGGRTADGAAEVWDWMRLGR